MSTRAETWTLFYSGLEKYQAVNLQMAQIMAFNRFQMVQEDYVSNLKSNLGLALLAVNGFHELLVFHNVHFQQQNLFCTESKLLGLLGEDLRQIVTILIQFLPSKILNSMFQSGEI
jgi:hypothetical protein